jgi:EAL domain-containing protein (putative c-di-GMP-specific phosphodiesterase class I)
VHEAGDLILREVARRLAAQVRPGDTVARFGGDVASDHRDAAIIEGIVTMADKLGLDMVVEGIETESQYACLRKQLCDTFQGFLFARPMPLDALVPFLEEHQQAKSL